MPHMICSDFLKGAAAYAEAQLFWETLWTELQTSVESESPWEIRWMHNTRADGNPIFTAVCWPQCRGVRIIQEEPRDADDVDLDWWLDYFGDKQDRDVIRELVIACCPSSENIPLVNGLLKHWIEHGEMAPEHPNGAVGGSQVTLTPPASEAGGQSSLGSGK